MDFRDSPKPLGSATKAVLSPRRTESVAAARSNVWPSLSAVATRSSEAPSSVFTNSREPSVWSSSTTMMLILEPSPPPPPPAKIVPKKTAMTSGKPNAKNAPMRSRTSRRRSLTAMAHIAPISCAGSFR